MPPLSTLCLISIIRQYRFLGEVIGFLYKEMGNTAWPASLPVQVIKPPTLIEISGPMFMSYPAINHLEIKLTEAAGVTTVTLRHRAFGMIDPAHRTGLSQGWGQMLAAVKADFSPAAMPA